MFPDTADGRRFCPGVNSYLSENLMSSPESVIAAPSIFSSSPTPRSLGIVAAASIGAGLLSHNQWPGSLVALVAAVPLVLLTKEQSTKGWSRDTLLCAAYSCVALLSVAIDPGALNLSLLWIGCAALALTGGGMALTLPAALLAALVDSIFRFVLPGKPNIDPQLASVGVARANGWFTLLVLPVLAAATFGALLISANPIIADFAKRMSWSLPVTYLFSISTPVALAAFLLMGMLMRMRPRTVDTIAAKLDIAESKVSRYFSRTSILITLGLLNVMFAAENVLDYAYIWQGISLPPGMTFTSYVHRGSYSLIATALLAAVLMIVIFRQGTDTQDSRRARWLVYLFAFQNVLLVASTAKRTVAYVDYSGMTLWRLSALIWMAVVAIGLLLIAVRVWRNHSTSWLLNSNLAVAALVLLGASLMNFVGIITHWNVERAAAGREIDFSYNYSLGPHALPALLDLQRRGLLSPNALLSMGPDQLNRVYATPELALQQMQQDLSTAQASPSTFTIRNWFVKQEIQDYATSSRG
jgi:hypothetical protein